METVFFYFFGALALAAAISVVVQNRVFYSALSLIVCLFAVGGLYLLLNSPFIAAIQVIVYAGAIMVLFLFVIMLLDPFSAKVLRDKKKSLAYLAAILGIGALVLLFPSLRAFDPDQIEKGHGLVGGGTRSIQHQGEALFNRYLIPFEVTSVLILIAIIGVVVLAKRQPENK
ncbi:MAG: NADH-quinone oxidoreductase subunit J [Chloroflexota bacterium]